MVFVRKPGGRGVLRPHFPSLAPSEGVGASLVGEEYIGQVMGQCHVPLYPTTTNFYFNSQSPHFAMDSGDRLRIGIPNWYDRDSAGPGDVTYSASIMDAAYNVLGQFLFSGSATGVAAPGATLVSDWLTVSYTQGTKYFIRIHGEGASGFVFNQPPTRNPSTLRRTDFDGNDSRWEASATSLADKTLSGTLGTSQSTQNDFCPIFIEGDTRRTSVLLVGDSLMYRGAANHGDYFDGVSPDVGYAERVLGGLGIAYINASSPGETAANFVSAHAIRAALASRVTHVWCGHVFNDVNSSRTTGEIATDTASIWGYFPDNRVIQALCSYATTGAWTLVDRSDQTVPASFAVAGKVDTVNAAILASAASLFGISDYRAAAFNVSDHKWLADGTVGKYTTDGTHSSQYAAQQIKASGLIPVSLFRRN